MNTIDLSRAVTLQFLDSRGQVIAAWGVAQDQGADADSEFGTVAGGRALHCGSVESFKLLDVDGAAVLVGSIAPFSVTAGQVI